MAAGPITSLREEYEVKCPQTWAWYPANIVGFDKQSHKFHIKYPDDWKKAGFEDGDSIRPAGAIVTSDWRPSDDEFCECKAKAEEHEPFGWWGCQVKSLSERQNGVYAFIQFDGWPEEHNEMLELEYLRPKNNNKTISSKNVIENIMDVPDYAKSFIQDKRNMNDIKQRLISLYYRQNEGKLVLIGTQKLVQLATNLVRLHFEKQRTLGEQRKKTQEYEQKLLEFKQREARSSAATFRVHPYLSGYFMTNKQKLPSFKRTDNRGSPSNSNTNDSGTIGIGRTSNSNTNNNIMSPSSSDVVTFKFGKKDGLEDGVCEIKVETKEGLKNVVDELQIEAKKLILPRSQMAKIIGTGGQDIRNLKKQVDVSRIISWSRFPEEYLKLKARYQERNKDTRPNSPPQTNDDNNNGEDNNTNKGRKGRRDRNDDNNNNTNNNATGYPNNESEVRALLKRYGVKFGKTKDSDGNIIETREYPLELSDEIHNFFNGKNNIVELLSDDEKLSNEEEDALVIIGKKSNVELCISMIMILLNHIRKLNNQRKRIGELRAKLREIRPITQSRSNESSDYFDRQNSNGSYYDNRRDRDNNNNRGGYGNRRGRDNRTDYNNNRRRNDSYRGGRGKGRRGGRSNRGDDDESYYQPREKQLPQRSNISVRRTVKPPKTKSKTVNKNDDNAGGDVSGKQGKQDENNTLNVNDSQVANGDATTTTKKGKNKNKNKRKKRGGGGGNKGDSVEATPQRGSAGAATGGSGTNGTVNTTDELEGETSGEFVSQGVTTTTEQQSKSNTNTQESNVAVSGTVEDNTQQDSGNKSKKRKRRRRKGGKSGANEQANVNDDE